MSKRLPPNWRKRIEIVINNYKKSWSFSVKFKDGETPKGFKLHIGSLEVGTAKGKFFVESIYVDEHFRDRRLGLLLYETALEHLGSLTTGYHDASSLARRCWNSLAKKYDWDCDFFGGYLHMYYKPLKKRKNRETMATFKKM